ncbi:MAG TPA: hypothetical protein VIK61_12970 [Acidimicrobiia bacterium]
MSTPSPTCTSTGFRTSSAADSLSCASHGWDLARKYERNIDRLGATTVVFNSVEDACVWLGIDPISTRRVIDTLRAGFRNP